MASNFNKLKQYIALRDMNVNELRTISHHSVLARTDDSYRSAFKVAFRRFDTVYNDFKKAHQNLITYGCLVEGTDLGTHELIRDTFENDAIAIQTLHHSLFGDPDDVVIVPSHQPNVRLPKIEVPKFSGDYKKFKSFIDIFNSLVHFNTSLQNIEKFTHLCNSLQGPPLALIQCTPLSEDNYIIAYEALVKRYHNKRLIATAYLQEIENCPRIPEHNANSMNLRKLLATFEENLAALSNMQFPVKEWDFILFFMLIKRLDSHTVTQFELHNHSNNDTIPTFESLKEFITHQCNALETADASQKAFKMSLSHTNKRFSTHSSYNNPSSNSQTRMSLMASTQHRSYSNNRENHNAQGSCIACKLTDHTIYTCQDFLSKSQKERYDFVKRHNWCVNCLGTKHSARSCPSRSVCRSCGQKGHHSLLHFSNSNPHNSGQPSLLDNFPQSHDRNRESFHNNSPPPDQNTPTSSVASLTGIAPNIQGVLLATAQVEILDKFNSSHKIRILLDCGSQVNFITQQCANRLGLLRFNLPLSVSGIGHINMNQTSTAVSCRVRPVDKTSPVLTIDAVILPKICMDLPSTRIIREPWTHIRNLSLADPNFDCTGPIDMLVGADVFAKILLNETVVGNQNEPIALSTIFGWVVMGSTNRTNNICRVNSLLCSINTFELDETLKRFWELEVVPDGLHLSPDEISCEKSFVKNCSRNDVGRYIVSLPFREDSPPQFGDTRSIALRRFYSLERRLLNNPSLHKQYSDFMRDYLDSGHMEKVSHNSSSNSSSENMFFIPHHCVLKPESTTTKLRVVFDASAKVPGFPSLNDSLLVGPKLQQNIVSLLLNFRLPHYVLTADIKQMYRQILMSPNHTRFQKILWRFSPEQPIEEFQLLTITYGVSSAPFLAIRTLQQLAEDEKLNYPSAAKILNSALYVDDAIFGSDSFDETLALRKELINILAAGGFVLRKWSSNDPKLLSGLPKEYLQNGTFSFESPEDSVIKILGLQWQPISDSFSYSIKSLNRTSCTKRIILSELARIYDPLGFLAPLTFFAKVLIQNLWALGLSWDETPPADVINWWKKYIEELPLLASFHLPRLLLSSGVGSYSLHGFCDSSERGYAAVIYLRFCSDISNSPQLSFVCAKSKVAPLKRISLPRLELCGAVLLTKLLMFTLETYKNKIDFADIYAWSDSSVALTWIKKSPHQYKTFISNRTAYIQERISPSHWRHVPTSLNAADCASRGLLPRDLLRHKMWLSGPNFLLSPPSSWPNLKIQSVTPAEENRNLALVSVIELCALDDLLERFSSLSKIKRILAYIVRFVHNSRNPRNKNTGHLTLIELHSALLFLVKRSQQINFSEDISRLQGNVPVSKKTVSVYRQ